MYERHAMRRTPARDEARRLRIGGEGGINILFCAVNGGVSSRIDHQRRLHTVQQYRQAVGLAEIGRFTGTSVGQDAAAGGRDHLAQRCQRAQQLLADLAVATEHQHGHGT